MNQMSNAPVMQGGPKPFYQVWMDALTKPSEMTFAGLATSPGAKASTAYLWVFIGSLVNFFLASLVQGAVMRRMMESFNQQGGGNFNPGFGGGLIGAICGAPIAAVIAVLFFIIGVAIVQWVAKMFGGRGTMEQLAYAFGAITAPVSIISGVLTLLSAIPFAGLCFSVVAGLLGLYVLVLEIMAVKGVNQIGWGGAAGSVLLPGLVIAFLCACVVGASMAVLGPSIQNVFQQIQQSGGY